MGKSSGIGDNFYIGGYDLSGDVASLDHASGGPAAIGVTGIKSLGNERIGGLRDGGMQFTSFFNAATGAEHPVLSALPRTDVIATYFRGTTLGNAAAAVNGKQVSYDGTRDNTGNLTLKAEIQANSFGLEWGTQITSGIFSAANSLTGQNAGFEGGLGTWVTGLGSPTLADSTAQHRTGTASMSMTSAAAGTMAAKHVNSATGGFAVTPGSQCYVQAWFLAGSAARSCEVAVNWYNSGGSLVSTSTGSTFTNNTSTWTVANGTFTAPATAAFATVIIQVLATAIGEVHYVDDMEFLLLPAGLDTGAATTFGAQAYLQVAGFTGTDVTVKVQDSADGITWADVTALAFTQVTAAPAAQRVAIASGSTVRRYVSVTAVSTGGFSALSCAVVLVKNQVAVSF